MQIPRLVTAATGALAAMAFFGGVADASAATLTAGSKCNELHRGYRPFPIAGTGWTPGKGTTAVGYRGEKVIGYASPDASGRFLAAVPAPPEFARRPTLIQKTFTLLAQDAANPAVTASARITVIRRTVLTPTASPRRKILHRFYGFPAHKKIYAHYGFGGRIRAHQYMGRAHGVCGKLRVRRRLLPTKVRYGTWTVSFTTTRKYSRKRVVYEAPLEVHRVAAAAADLPLARTGLH